MRVTVIILLICTSLFFQVNAQKTEDVLYLKNESIIRGEIIENNENKIKIKTNGGNIFAFSPAEVLSTSTEKIVPLSVQSNFGYVNYTTCGVLIGSTENQRETPFSIQMEHSLQINKHFSLGAITGLETLNEIVAPVGISGRFHFAHSSNSHIFLSANSGYSFSLEKPVPFSYQTVKSSDGGYFANSEIGFVVKKSKIGLIVALGYRYNTLKYVLEDPWMGDVKTKIFYNRLGLRVGVVIF